MAETLAQEIESYRVHLPRLLGKSEGKYVLIHGSTIAGIFDNEQQAILAGYESFGAVPFLVQPITRQCERICFGPGHLGP